MWGYNTNMGQFGGPMTPRMNMGGGPRGFNPWMQGIPNGFTPPNFANNMGEVFGGMPGGGPMQFNMGSQPGKMPGTPMPMGGTQPGQGGGDQFMIQRLPKGMTIGDYDRAIMGNQPRPMEIPPQIAQQLFGYQKPVNDIYQESPGKSTRSKGDTGWLNSMLTENPYLRPMRVGNSGMGGMPMGGFNPRMMGGGMGMGLGMGMNSPQMSTQQAAELYFKNMFGGGMGSRNNQSNSGNYYNLVNPIELLGLGGMSSSAAGQIPGLYYPA